jgi:hypothetical protein
MLTLTERYVFTGVLNNMHMGISHLTMIISLQLHFQITPTKQVFLFGN